MNTLKAKFLIGMMDNLRLAQLADQAIKEQQFEVCGVLRDEINLRAYDGRLNDVYYNAAQLMGFTDNALFEVATSVNASINE